MIDIALRDRGKMKWKGAFFMPEQVKAQHELWRDTQRQIKPIIDEDEKEEFDQQIGYAMEYNLPVKLTIWGDGFTEVITGKVYYIDQITHQLRIETKPGEFERVAFASVIGVAVGD
ncbi:YolD-like protein [Mesobacillus persicus]|uniref:YolD-like protein n=2 Tax=Mesobacillus persicus TaxID=930146 RepID=A0A1H8AVL8_9BACI|nr:YolD-like protein [Mesobacillus persicus]